jgi:hypothetical protein
MNGNADDDDRTGTAARPVSVDIDIADGRTTIAVSGDRDAAVVVRSAAGERIYLPPEDFDRPPASETAAGGDARGTGSSPSDSPYQPVGDADSPYQSAAGDSPYQRGGGTREHVGLEPTADGFRIVHPEPADDVRILR